MQFPQEMITELVKGKTPEELLGQNGLYRQLKKQIIEAALEGEMTHHLGYEKHEKAGKGNSRNGYTKKTVKDIDGKVEIQVPRDRDASFDPSIVKKRQSRFEGFDQTIISMYARGMTTREIQAHLREIYCADVSAGFISTVTEEVTTMVTKWQGRPLEAVYPVVYMDALRVKVRNDHRIVNKAVHVALGINLEGEKEVLGMWIGLNEGAAFWLKVLTELNNRGVQDIYVACIDGLKGFPEAINSVFPFTAIQLCIVHMIRNSLRFVAAKRRKEVATDLRAIYKASTEANASEKLKEFRAKWDDHYPQIGESWDTHWPDLVTFLEYPSDIRRILYTTNPLESVNAALRKITKTRRVFPNDAAVSKLLYLGLENASKRWGKSVANWSAALNTFKILYEDRFPF